MIRSSDLIPSTTGSHGRHISKERPGCIYVLKDLSSVGWKTDCRGAKVEAGILVRRLMQGPLEPRMGEGRSAQRC